MKHVLETFQTLGKISRNISKQKEIKMKTNYPWTLAVNRMKLTGLALAAGVMLTQPVMAAGPAPINLASCSNFVVLAGSAVTFLGAPIINGDVGLSPAGAVELGTPPATINGTIYNGGSIAEQGQVDLTAAFIAASPAALPGGINVGAELGGQNLAPGIYQSPSGEYLMSLDLTLTGGADDVWVFQMASTLTVMDGKKIILAGGAQAKNIFWQVGSSATLNTGSVFYGTIMAQASITMLANSTMSGRALARTGAVTFGGSGGSLPTKLSQVITNFMPTNGSVFAGSNIVGLSAQADSGLAVSFKVKSGPGAILGGTNLHFANTGLVRIAASQAGNENYFAALTVTNTFTIIPPLSTVPGGLEIQMTPASGSWRLTAPAGYTGPTSGTGNLAPVVAALGEYTIAYGALSGYMLPTNNNQAQVVISGVTSLFVGVYRPVSADLAPPVVTATKGTYTDRILITWRNVSGVTSYEIWKSQANDVNTAVLVAEVPDYGTEVFLYNDGDVVPVRSYYYWGLSRTATQVSPISLVSIGYAKLSPVGRAINDYDGDGRSDAAVYRDGYWSLFTMADGLVLDNEGFFGGLGWTPVPGDYDGDRKCDVAVYRDGYWSIFTMADGLVLDNEGFFGGPGWEPVQ